MTKRQIIAATIREAFQRQQRHGLSLAELAHQLGVSPSAMHHYVSGARLPSATALLHLAKLLQIDLESLASRVFVASAEKAVDSEPDLEAE